MARRCSLVFFGLLAAAPASAQATLLQEPTRDPGSPTDHPIPTQTGAAAPDYSWTSILLALAAIGCAAIIIRKRWYDPMPSTGIREPPIGRVADWPVLLLGGMLVWIAQIAGAGSAAMLFSIGADQSDSLRATALTSLGAYTGAAIAIVLVLSLLPGIAERIGWSRPSAAVPRTGDRAASTMTKEGTIGVVAFLMGFPIVMTIGWLAAIVAGLLTGAAPAPLAHKTLLLLTNDSLVRTEGVAWWWLICASVVIGAPIVEETVYRGFLQGAIRRGLDGRSASHGAIAGSISTLRQNRVAAVLVISTVFSLMHASAAETHALVTLFVLSLVFGVLRERSGGITAPIVVHMLFNATNLVASLNLDR